MKGRPSGPRHWATSPSGSARERPRALADRLDEEREGLARGAADRIEKGRRSGGSAERPALIITNWPGRASRAASGWRKVSRKYGPPSASRATRGAIRLAGIRRDHIRACTPAKRRRRVRPRRADRIRFARAAADARERRPRGLDRGRACSSTLALYLNPGLVLRREAPGDPALPVPAVGARRARCRSRSSRPRRARAGGRAPFRPLFAESPVLRLAHLRRARRSRPLLYWSQPARLPPRAARRRPARARRSRRSW